METATEFNRNLTNLSANIKRDIISRLRHLNMESITLLPKYTNADTEEKMSPIYQVGSDCINSILYIEQGKYNHAIETLLNIDTSIFSPDKGYEENLTYLQDKWDLELIAIITSLKHLMGQSPFDIHSIVCQVKSVHEYKKDGIQTGLLETEKAKEIISFLNENMSPIVWN